MLAVVLLCFVPQIAAGATPKNTLAMAFNMDDQITLDPAEIFQFTVPNMQQTSMSVLLTMMLIIEVVLN